MRTPHLSFLSSIPSGHNRRTVTDPTRPRTCPRGRPPLPAEICLYRFDSDERLLGCRGSLNFIRSILFFFPYFGSLLARLVSVPLSLPLSLSLSLYFASGATQLGHAQLGGAQAGGAQLGGPHLDVGLID